MRSGNLFLIASSLTAIFMAIACQQRTPIIIEEEDPGATDSKDQTSTASEKKTPSTKTKTDNSCLGKAGLAFDDAECSQCMSDDASCCQATITCFKDDADCAALHSCMTACESGNSGAPGATTSATTVFTGEVYPAVQRTCGSCHLTGTGGAPIFFGADATSSYSQFKAKGYHLANSRLVTKGVHNGPALTADQRAAIDKWVAAEAAPQAGADAGSGSCKDTCKANHAASVEKWTAFNNCTVNTCKSSCVN